jgi:hypothetical protein
MESGAIDMWFSPVYENNTSQEVSPFDNPSDGSNQSSISTSPVSSQLCNNIIPRADPLQ